MLVCSPIATFHFLKFIFPVLWHLMSEQRGTLLDSWPIKFLYMTPWPHWKSALDLWPSSINHTYRALRRFLSCPPPDSYSLTTWPASKYHLDHVHFDPGSGWEYSRACSPCTPLDEISHTHHTTTRIVCLGTYAVNSTYPRDRGVPSQARYGSVTILNNSCQEYVKSAMYATHEQARSHIRGNSTQTSFFWSSGSDATTSSSPLTAMFNGNGRQYKPHL